MADAPMYTVLLLSQKNGVKEARIVTVHHDADLAEDGDENSAFYTMPNPGDINTSRVLLMNEFRKKVISQPWLISLVTKALEEAPKVASKNRVQYLFDRYGTAKTTVRIRKSKSTKSKKISREPFVEAA